MPTDPKKWNVNPTKIKLSIILKSIQNYHDTTQAFSTYSLCIPDILFVCECVRETAHSFWTCRWKTMNLRETDGLFQMPKLPYTSCPFKRVVVVCRNLSDWFTQSLMIAFSWLINWEVPAPVISPIPWYVWYFIPYIIRNSNELK